jgi:hypothetical protein
VNIREWSIFLQQIKDPNVNFAFTLGIWTPWQLQCLLKYGQSGTIFRTTTFGSNDLKFQLFIFVVLDKCKNDMPINWITMSCHKKLPYFIINHFIGISIPYYAQMERKLFPCWWCPQEHQDFILWHFIIFDILLKAKRNIHLHS